MSQIEKLLEQREHCINAWVWAGMKKDKAERDLREVEEKLKQARAEEKKDGAA